METGQLKNYAPQARRDFIEGVKNRAAVYGLLPKEILPMKEEGDVVIIGDRPFPRSVAKQRKELEERIRREGFNHFIEAIAYTWFNRFVAIRFMELHGYLDHSYRVLSHPEGKSTPQILENAERVELPGLNRDKVIELKLDGTQDEALYRLLLLAQCNALHQAMPFLFEKIGDADELLLPANLLHTDSLIRQMVEQVDEQSWQQIEIIGWLYQFYISEKKDQVIGKVVKSEDIPAATQLFTPNWIVKYMVQNSLGAQWLATYPDSPLKAQMEYYIEPAEQTDEVNAQLAAITPNELNPEELTLIDPASGSGHILVEAYELFKAIYLERGYRQRDVPQLILEKNLFGLDIDPRAAQLTGFALMMKGRADNRRLFERGVKLNVMALVDSTDCDPDEIYSAIVAIEQKQHSAVTEAPAPSGLLFETEDNLFTRTATVTAHNLQPSAYSLTDISELIKLFEHATTFGSLIQVPEGLAEKLPALKQLSETTSQDLFVSEALKRLGPLVRQAELLAAQYDAVVANPPYMGSKGMTAVVKAFLRSRFPDGEKDVFAAFMIRAKDWVAGKTSTIALVTPFSWMYLSSFERLREQLLAQSTIESLIELETNAFEPAMVTVCSFIVSPRSAVDYSGCFVRLSDFKGSRNQAPRTLEAIRDRDCGWFYTAKAAEFGRVPGTPIAYWLGPSSFAAFGSGASLADVAEARIGMATGRNDYYVRKWAEVSSRKTNVNAASRDEALESGCTWFPYAKGGEFRRWYGNHESVVNWKNDGAELQTTLHPDGSRIWAHNFNLEQIFQEAMSWTFVTSGPASFRLQRKGFLFDSASGLCRARGEVDVYLVLGWLNSKIAMNWLRAMNPTLNLPPGPIESLPFSPSCEWQSAAPYLIQLAKGDWDAYERSWDFQSTPLLAASPEVEPTIESSYAAWITQNRATIAEMKRLEEENNRLFIDAYGLADELTPDVPIEQITLTVNPAYRYGGKLTEEELWTRFRQDTMEELVSYAIGCMMGRYSLDSPGLIYAHSGNEGFDPSQYTTFPADDDAIIPLTDTEWFDDDAAKRLVEFISVAWDERHLEANLSFLADNLNPKKSESSRETIRRYLCDSFFKDHLQTYKKRPIYWLFSSGKQKAFQCLVYLHRYNEGTLARIRTKYVVPLQGKLNARIEQLESDIPAAGSTSHRKRLENDRTRLIKQREELQSFDENLRHYADHRMHLDLDDGVKVNYGKFGDLLAEVKTITGEKPQV